MHLQNVDFPRMAKRPIVDILIGVDCADLFCAISEVRGGPGEPVARLTPLGWTCVETSGSCCRPVLQTSLSYTYFVKGQSGIDTINAHLKKFWETEDGQLFKEIPIVRIDEQIAMKKVGKSMEYENHMYRVGVPWKDNKPSLPDNYGLVFHKPENKERRLKRSPDVATTYNQCIEQYIKKGNIRKVPVYEQPRSKWYLPHFPVIRLDKDTMKTRIYSMHRRSVEACS